MAWPSKQGHPHKKRGGSRPQHAHERGPPPPAALWCAEDEFKEEEHPAWRRGEEGRGEEARGKASKATSRGLLCLVVCVTPVLSSAQGWPSSCNARLPNLAISCQMSWLSTFVTVSGLRWRSTAHRLTAVDVAADLAAEGNQPNRKLAGAQPELLFVRGEELAACNL